MKCNEAGLKIIRDSEGCRLEAYLCPAGLWTIGWGTTGPAIRKGMKCTQAEADAMLAAAVSQFEDLVLKTVKVPLSENQFSALVSFAYNVRNWRSSTLIRKLNAGDMAGAAAEFPRWINANGKVMPGLVTRRKLEQALFLS